MKIIANIAEAGNTTYRFPLDILAGRGFTVLVRPSRRTKGDAEYLALHADGVRIWGSTPLALLGQLAILDALGPDWYTEPKIELPEGHIVDFDPQALTDDDEEGCARAHAAFQLLCSFEERSIECSPTRSSLAAAYQRFLELDDEDERRANED